MSEVPSDDQPERHGSAAPAGAESAQYDLEPPEHYELPNLSHVMEEDPRTETTRHMLDIFSYNVNKMESKVRDLGKYAKRFECKTRPTILMIQDPPYNVAKIHLPKYHLVSKSDWIRPKSDKDKDQQKTSPAAKNKPKNSQDEEDDEPKPVSRRVAIYVSTAIHPKSWEVTWDEGVNKGYVAYMLLRLLDGSEVYFTNFYNRKPGESIDLEHLFKTPAPGLGFDVLGSNSAIFCDSNAHSIWDPGSEPDKCGRYMSQAFLERSMDIRPTYNKRKFTYRRKAAKRKEDVATNIDLAVLGNTIDLNASETRNQHPQLAELIEAFDAELHANRALHDTRRDNLAYDERYEKWVAAIKETNRFSTIANTVAFRNRAANLSEGLVSLHKIMAQARRTALTQMPPHLQYLKTADGTFCQSQAENAHVLRSKLFDETSDSLPPAGEATALGRHIESRMEALDAERSARPKAKPKSRPCTSKKRKGKQESRHRQSSTPPPRSTPQPSRPSPEPLHHPSPSGAASRPAENDFDPPDTSTIVCAFDTYSSVPTPGSLLTHEEPPFPGSPLSNIDMSTQDDCSMPDADSTTCGESQHPEPSPSKGQKGTTSRAQGGKKTAKKKPQRRVSMSGGNRFVPPARESTVLRSNSKPGGLRGNVKPSQQKPLDHPSSDNLASDVPSNHMASALADSVSSRSIDSPFASGSPSASASDPPLSAGSPPVSQKARSRPKKKRISHEERERLAKLKSEPPPKLNRQKVRKIVKRLPARKAPGPDEIPNPALKIAVDVLLPYLLHLFNACIKFHYHPVCFKESITIVIPKEGKSDYTDPKNYRPIALLSCIGKVLERLVADYIKELAIKYDLIPFSQYGFAGKSAPKAVEHLVSGIVDGFCARTTKKKWRTSLLALDVSGAYDHVKHLELIDILIDVGVPKWLVHYIKSFVSDRSTSVVLPGFTSPKFWVRIGIPQGSPLSPILFVLFMAPMLRILDNEAKLGRSKYIFTSASYVDDTCIMVTSTCSTFNCKKLAEVHNKLISWAQPRGLLFDPTKYKVMHFRPRKGGNGCLPLCTELPEIEHLDERTALVREAKEPATNKDGNLRVLGVWLDHQLSWKYNVHQIKEKVNRKMDYMKRKISSVSGPSLLKMCQLYATSIRPIIAYACPVWFVVPSIEAKGYGLNQTLIDKLDAIQTGCLRVFAGVLSKTSSLPLHKEVNMEPIAVYLQRMAMSHRACNSMAEDGKLLIGKTTKFPFKSTRSPCFKKQPYFKLYQAASRLAEKAKDQYLSKNLPDVWDNAVDRRIAINEYLEAQSDTLCRYIWWWFKEKRKRRSTRQSWYGTHCHPLATRGDWGASNLKRHQHLTRVESTIILHCRTGFIGLNSYLYKRTLADSPMCPCGTNTHTVEHLFFECPLLANARRNLPVTKWTVKLIEGRFGRWASRKRTLEQLIDEHPRTMAQLGHQNLRARSV
ncbi:RNA-directed DNA polymerase from mobile element jockey [Colletotrichum aenigma]|uniref:RNA-directed DNA polymerase from mobile element jockey n=1 Tax=Colletotrichum aenigma TaxID=1215731 RepID=UPI001872B8E4|nr:RNA-directed DNA polymerase from mobile element jockey [Colletotrichum aenigma]KAF5524844.1 RNA-directed DNA polymerase from mobile element jockey [Colletotrichum aenigma]